MSGDTDEGSHQSPKTSAVGIRKPYDWSATSPSTAAIRALASIENVTPIDLADAFDAPLYEYVDPEALDALVRNGGARAPTVTVEIEDYRLQFDGGGLEVTEANSPPTS